MHARAEHVYVIEAQVWGDVPLPGLLAEWRQVEGGGYEGLVIFVQVHPQGAGWSLTQKWLPAAKIRRRDD
jgi:hypothetical protein